jgi:hypothetical protein
MVNPDIRKLQILNDLIAQTLDVINQRSMSGGLSHSPYVPEFGMSPINPALAQYGLGSYGLPQAMVPFAQPQIGQIPQGVPFGLPWTQGLTHTPFTPWGAQTGQAFGGFGQGVPGQSYGQGMGGGFGQGVPGQPYGQGVGGGFGQGVPGQPYGQGIGGGFGQGALGQPFGQGLMHTPFTAWGGQPGQGLGGFGQGVFGQQLGQGLAGFGQQLGQLPYVSPWTQGLMHSPFTGVPGQGYGVDPRLALFGSPYSQAGFGAGRFGGIGAIPGVMPGIGVSATGVPFYGFGG